MDNSFNSLIKQIMLSEGTEQISNIERLEGLDKWFAVMENVDGVVDLERTHDVVTFLFQDVRYTISRSELMLNGQYEMTCNTFERFTTIEALKMYEKDVVRLISRMRKIVRMPRPDEFDFVVNVRENDIHITVELD